MHTAGDAAIWEYAGANGCVLLTKDEDFRRSMAAELSADIARVDPKGTLQPPHSRTLAHAWRT
jgi:hypothetical protein